MGANTVPRVQRSGKLPQPAGVAAGFLIGGAGFILTTLAYTYLATHPVRRPIRRTPDGLDLPFEDVTFRSTDGLRLNGWLIPAPTNAPARGVVIVCHGYPQNREEMLPHAEMLHDLGYATLLFDFRRMGESEGDVCTAGHLEVADLLGALDYVSSRPDTTALPVAALGHSLGGAVSIMAAARDERIRVVISEASYPTLHDAVEARFRFVLRGLSGAVAHPVRRWARRWVSVDTREVAPIEAIRSIAPRAVMIIQGKRDILVRWRDAVTMYENAAGPRELWLLERSGHVQCLEDEPAEYAARVGAFLNAHLGRAAGA